MIRLLITLVFLLLTHESSFSQKGDFNKYYEFVNLANDAYDSAIYKQAANYFDSAFKLVKEPYAKNLERAVEISIKNKNYTKGTSYAEKAANAGYLIKDTLIAGLASLCNKEINSTSLNSQMTTALARKNQKFIRLIDSLFRVDQNFRNNRKAYVGKGNIDSFNRIR